MLNTHKNKLFWSPELNETSQQMVAALRHGFELNHPLKQAICEDQQSDSIDSALQSWLQGNLLLPDQHFGMLLMPVIAQRFDEYLSQLRSTNPWIQ